MKCKEVTRTDCVSIIGSTQFIYSSKKGEISLISLPNYNLDGTTVWEIYCLKGGIFEDIERFDTQEQAVKKCEVYL